MTLCKDPAAWILTFGVFSPCWIMAIAWSLASLSNWIAHRREQKGKP